jgi:hypothetical protein
MDILGNSGAPLGLYNAIFDWHTQNMEAKSPITRNNLIASLETKYDQSDAKPFLKKCYLPSIDKVIKLVVHDAASQLKAILTHPSIKDDHYNFIDGDPFAPPPKEWIKVGDINTGRAFRATYDELIRSHPFTKEGRRKILVPVLFYMDGCQMGQYDKLPLEAFKMSLAIFKPKIREKYFAWRPLGYVSNNLKESTQAVMIIRNSGHVAKNDYLTASSSSSDDE